MAQPAPLADTDPPDDAGFTMGALSCPGDLSSDDTLTCSATWKRDFEGDLGALAVQWFVDGVLASQENSVGESATFSLPQPAPGSHTVQVQLVDLASGASGARSTNVTVSPGENARVPVSTRAGVAAGATVVLGGWLWIEWRRVRQAASLAQRRAAAAEAADRALEQDRQAWYEAQMQRNRQERQQRQEREAAATLAQARAAYAQAGSRAHRLAREQASLTRKLQRLRADWDYTRYTAVSDGIIDIADLVIDVGLRSSSGVAGAGAKSWAKGLVKGAVRQKIGETVDGRPADYDALDELLSAAGLPPDYARGRAGLDGKRGWDRIAYDLAPRGAVKQGYVKYLEGTPARRFGRAVGPAESVISGVHDAASKADRAAELRRQMVVVDQQLRRRKGLFKDALDDLSTKCAALDRARDTIDVPKGLAP